MSPRGADVICSVLRQLGVPGVFGLPGTQNVRLYEALRAAGLRRIVTADEGSAAFAATGFARASGTVGVLTTIPGPGFVHALAGIVEAHHDSAPVLWITQRPADQGRAFQLQRIDQAAMAAPVVKRCLHVRRAEDLADVLVAAYAHAQSGEPGPVLLEIDAPLLDAPAEEPRVALPATEPRFDLQALAAALAACRFPVIIAGQGAQGAAPMVRALAARWNAPVLFTSSGRGTLSDEDPLAFVQDFSTGLGPVLPDLLQQSDLILALGCKFTHNGSAGGRLTLPAAKLVRVDASAEVLAANYPARLALEGRVEDVLAGIASALLPVSQWRPEDLAAARARLVADRGEPIDFEPTLLDVPDGRVRDVFAAFGRQAGDRAMYVADAGLHQALTRRYASVRRPRGLLCPSDFQSMGFGLPGAIGAALAQPGAEVIACIGDAGLVLSMGDLVTAVREGVNLVVVVFNDGQMNLIRRQQLATYGHESGVDVAVPQLATLAEAVGCSYFPVHGDLETVIRDVLAARGVRLVELRLADQPSLEWQRVRAVVRAGVRNRVPDGAVAAVKRLLGR